MLRAVSTRLGLCLLFLLCFSHPTFAQGAKLKAADQDRETLRGEDPAGRDRWFRKGRNTIDGTPAAQWLQRAYRQKMEFRKQRQSLVQPSIKLQVSGTTTGTTNATTPVAGSSAVWTPTGPGPIVDDGLIGQNYGPNTGRATAVAINPADATGNTVVIGGAYGGAWLSTNAAATDPTTVTWTPILDQQASLAVGSVSWSPDGSVLLVGTGEGNSAWDSYYGVGFYRSTDNGATWSQISSSTDGHSFNGMAIQRMAWSKTSPTRMVAAVATASRANLTGGNVVGGQMLGIYYSTDSGQSWKVASMTDGSVGITPGSVSSVTWNASDERFYAVIRRHGVYVSAPNDPTSFTRLAKQPDAASSGLNSTTTCPASISDITTNNCPIYRGEITANPARNELYIWWIDLNINNKGIWRSTDSGATWTQLTDTGFTSCSDPTAPTAQRDIDGCGATQAFFNMTILAQPHPGHTSWTDLYLGSVNIYKCTIDPSAASGTGSDKCGATTEPFKFMNLTHVYGCVEGGDTAHVHPDAHDMSAASPSIIYFAHDGGISRTLDSTGLVSGLCTAHNNFDNLNYNMGSMTQLVWGTAIPGDAGGTLAGSQDNGSMVVYTGLTPTNGQTWVQANGGDGGYTEIDPNTVGLFYTSNTDVSVQVCDQGTACQRTDYNNSLGDPNNYLVDNTDLASDKSAFYSPYMLDPQLTTKMLVGTCRVWRGPTTRTPSNTWNGFAISQQLDGTNSTTGSCADTDPFISGIDTGGALASGAGSKAVWAVTDMGGIWRTLDQSPAASGSPVAFVNVTLPSTQNPGPFWTGPGFPASSVAVDKTDATGKTAYITLQGFHVDHIFKTTDGGAIWTAIGTTANGLPDAPVNNVVIDPDDHNVLYAASDLGVYALDQSVASPQWIEVGPNPTSGQAGYLPNVTAFRVIIQKVGARKLLKAVTYGRGVWTTDIYTPPPYPALTSSPIAPSNLNFGTKPIQTSSNQTVTINSMGAPALGISSISTSGTSFSQTNTCGTSVASGASCTIKVTFNSATVGSKIGALDITTNANAPDDHLVFNLSGIAEDFAITPPVQTSATVSAGSSAAFDLSIAGSGGSFSNTITFACSGLGTGMACSFNPSSVTPNAGTVSTTVTITTRRASSTTMASAKHSPGLLAVFLGLPAVILLVPSRKRRNLMLSATMVLLVAVLILGMSSCGGGGSTGGGGGTPGTPAGTYNVTVTGTSGSLTHTTALTVVVQ